MRKTIPFLLAFLVCFVGMGEAAELLYSRLTDGFWQIWREGEDGKAIQLTFSPYDKRYPSVTRKGEVLYHTHNNECFRMAGEKEEKLLADLWPVRDLTPSPTEELFAFSRFRTDLVDRCNLWLFDPATGSRTMLTKDEGIQYQPAWSPDGSKIAYSAGSGPNSYEIFVVNRDSSEKRQLTQNQSNDFTPAWSPDGTKIVFSSNATGDYEIWVMNSDGTDAKQLTDSPGLDTRPVFSPDGSRIAFTSNRSGHLEIWVMNTDGSDPHRWIDGETPTCDPFWF